jgi:hypothetical protein
MLHEELVFDTLRFEGLPAANEPITVKGVVSSLVAWVNEGYSIFELLLEGDHRRFVHSVRSGLLVEFLHLLVGDEIEFTCYQLDNTVCLIRGDNRILKCGRPLHD